MSENTEVVKAQEPTQEPTSTEQPTETPKEEVTKTPEITADPKEILKQVEFYFSDQNLPTDKFLYTLSQKNDGWVPISTIAVFSRMKRFRPLSAIADALRQSEKLLEVSEDGELVRRKSPLVEPKSEEKQDAFARSIYAKGFGEESETTQVDIEKYFEQFGKFKQVRLRRDDSKKFKSSVFVEFASLEDAKKFLALDPAPTYKDNKLVTMSKTAYVEMKAAEHGFTVSANGNKRFNAFKEAHRGDYKRKREHNDDNKRGHNGKRRGGPQNKSRPPRQQRDRENKGEEGDKKVEQAEKKTEEAKSTEVAATAEN